MWFSDLKTATMENCCNLGPWTSIYKRRGVQQHLTTFCPEFEDHSPHWGKISIAIDRLDWSRWPSIEIKAEAQKSCCKEKNKHKQTMTISFFAPAAKCQLLLSSFQSNVIQRRVAARIILHIPPLMKTRLNQQNCFCSIEILSFLLVIFKLVILSL